MDDFKDSWWLLKTWVQILPRWIFFWGGEICSNGFTSTCIVWAIDKLEKNAIASKRWLKVVAV
jgi:hypothetical protein